MILRRQAIVKQYGLNELRKMFLDFFESKDHLIMNSFSLVPKNDKSLLLINSGMAPLKPYFTGQEIPPRKRVTTCQKCIRTGDIENVGKTSRHGTFFEMLGNFSFGDYFKHEAIAWSYEFLTQVVGLDPNRLFPSVYEEDNEAFDIWNKEIKIPADRIYRLGKADNYWEHGAGPCGPCSEIYYDRGEEYGCGEPGCGVGCECDRYIEIWNNVFTQFESDGNGNYTELEQKNIDTGMGLERLATIVQDVPSIFDVDTIKALRDKVCEITHVTYGEDEKKDVSIRLITDHIRSVTFMISDGIIPSNEGRGYVLRRLLRRGARHGRLLGINEKFLALLSETVIETSKDGYPELEEKKDYILKLLTIEEDNFNKTIDQGLNILSEFEEELNRTGEKVLAGENAFKLYDTYGFPLDLTKEILEEKGLKVDEEGFNKAMEVQRETARSARGTTNYMGTDETVYQQIDPFVSSKFVGYETLEASSKILVLTTKSEIVKELVAGQEGTVIVEETPFYGTSGGQVGDTGIIKTQTGEFIVEDTIKLQGEKIGHIGHVTKGIITVDETADLVVDQEKRLATGKNHSATHLLQKALKTVLGSHVEQAGSLVTDERLRFDFTHFKPMTIEEIKKVEDIVNKEIMANLVVKTELMPIEEAKKTGAMALFGEKYSDIVRVVSMGDFSRELCGGTHVSNTGAIMAFKILSDTSIAAGVRRIEALTGNNVFKYFNEIEKELNQAAKAAKSEPSELIKKIDAMQEELKALHQENEKLKDKLAKESLGDVMDQVVMVNDVKILAIKVPDVDMNGLRNLGDQLKDKLEEGVIVLASATGAKVSLLTMVTDGAMAKGAHAGNLVKEIASLVGGGGGGRPNMAQAGGKNPAGIDSALKQSIEVLKDQIKS